MISLLYIVTVCVFAVSPVNCKHIVIGTWPFVNASLAAWDVLERQSGTAVDAVVAGASKCEEEQCDSTVGYGGSPDEHAETTLDALIMDGSTYGAGAVANLHNIKDAIRVAHAIVKHTKHTMLVGHSATEFAVSMGFQLSNLSTSQSVQQWQDWKNNNCQPNFWQNVVPDPTHSCGPYSPLSSRTNGRTEHAGSSQLRQQASDAGMYKREVVGHDTIGLVAIDKLNNIAAGTSTNGAKFKIPGRVGDSPIIGSGAYADSNVGGAAATGDGDVMMKFLPSFLAVELMRNGATPAAAADQAVARISSAFPSSSSAVVALNKDGQYGASCHGFSWFSFTVMSPDFSRVEVVDVNCSKQN